ncbi:hypothetical protein HDU76_013801, partial [Blyttiomyces sp. JEL0837]
MLTARNLHPDPQNQQNTDITNKKLATGKRFGDEEDEDDRQDDHMAEDEIPPSQVDLMDVDMDASGNNGNAANDGIEHNGTADDKENVGGKRSGSTSTSAAAAART